MAITLLHLADIHLGSGFSHGTLNPQTGLNTRFEDFVGTLGCCIDRATGTGAYDHLPPVDLVVFAGDAFPDATPPPVVQEAFATQFHRLVDAQIPTVLLVGNHDQYAQGQGGASLCIYRTLGVPGFVVGDRLDTHLVQTQQGPIQVVTLPWLTRSTFLTRPLTENLSLTAVNELLLDRLRLALEGEIRRLDPTLPTILLGHVMVDTAFYGAERFLAVGKGITVPVTLLSRPCFDYVALGHVHRHQILGDRPPIVYPGSIERVDFSEEKEDKGFVIAHIERGNTQVEFCPLSVRPFCTIAVDVSTTDNPQGKLEQAIASQPITDAVVRLIYKLRPDQVERINHSRLLTCLETAHTHTIQPELVSQLTRPRLPELGMGKGLEPLDALETYLANRQDLQEIRGAMVEAAANLLAGTEAILVEEETTQEDDLYHQPVLPLETEIRQLRLL